MGLVALEVQKAEFGNFTVPVNNLCTLACRTFSFVFLATYICTTVCPDWIMYFTLHYTYIPNVLR